MKNADRNFQSGRNRKAVSKKVRVLINGGATMEKTDLLAREEPLEVRLNTKPFYVTMRTPGNDEELAAGFLLTEGIIQSRRQLISIRPYKRNPDGNVVDVFLSEDTKVDFRKLARNVFTSSSCGMCGKASIDSVRQKFRPLRDRTKFSRETIFALPEKLRAAQSVFEQTGGLHAAGIFNSVGNLLVSREDVGRHNAVDKVIGHALLEGKLPLSKHILMVSGRASFEIMQKALAARIPVVAAVSAPSSLAVEFADASGMTLIGFLRDGRMNVYSRPERTTGSQHSPGEKKQRTPHFSAAMSVVSQTASKPNL